MERETLIRALSLNKIFGENPKIANQFIKYYGSTEAVFQLPKSELEIILINQHPEVYNEALLQRCEEELSELSGYTVLAINDENYPTRLIECPDAPIALYIRYDGENLKELLDRPAISIIGTRNMSSYGKEYCKKIVYQLASLPVKPLIVSGLAYGIDITAHLAALEYGLPTLGVSPVGIKNVYPASHVRHVDKILQEGGAIVSDFPLGTPLQKLNFLRRNRIIAGLSDATILIESKNRGGGMMTARLASSYSRQVLALPGRIDDSYSSGCNELISKNIAACIDSLDNLNELLGYPKGEKRQSVDIIETLRTKFCKTLSNSELNILIALITIIKKCRGINIDELCEAGEMSYSQISGYLTILEKEGFITIDLMQSCTINY